MSRKQSKSTHHMKNQKNLNAHGERQPTDATAR